MLQLIYSKTSNSLQSIKTIDSLRVSTLTTPLTLYKELEFQWDALIERIRFTQLAKGRAYTPQQIHTYLTHEVRPSDQAQMARIYRTAFNYLHTQWLGNAEQVTKEDVIELLELLELPESAANRSDLERTLEYLQVTPEHPVIQSGIIHAAIPLIFFGAEYLLLAKFLSYLFLYKQGYDFRRLIVLEEHLFSTQAQYSRFINNIKRQYSLTDWLEYYITIVKNSASSTIIKIAHKKEKENNVAKSLLILSDRQKKILGLFDEPTSRMTNRDIQKKFKVSQITASRDLAKLASLGLLFTSGKGRSVYYTKV